MKLPVKIVIFNNGVLGFVAMEMAASGFIEAGVDLKNADFAAMARAMGIHAVRVEDPGELSGVQLFGWLAVQYARCPNGLNRSCLEFGVFC